MPNRLAKETSPYLLQHQDNPVEWWPWCDEAFQEAKRRDVPVFVSIGYATCHWCHVMAHESFEDEEVARRMNEAFVNIKVDREERPDVDDVYMQVCQAMTGHGGWPLNVLLTPDREPWFAGTYFPKRSAGQRMGMLDLVPALQDAWSTKREDVTKQAEHLVEHLRRPQPSAGDVPDEQTLSKALDALRAAFDADHGGFGRTPKFPSLHQVRFLLRMHLRGAEGALEMARATLDGMARGGIRDHVGGGFHRYSTDARWHLPHFEKMLYDQAMALLAYGEAYMLTQDPLYKEVIQETAAYLERDMRHESGAFFAAEDADAEGEEGRFTTWPWDELLDVLRGDEELARALGARPGGNFHEEASGEPVQRNILFAADPEALGGPLADRWSRARPRLLSRREERVRPLRDEKVLTDWNGLAIAGLAVTGRALRDDHIIGLARSALEGILELQLDLPGGHGELHWDRLRHVWCDGHKGDGVFLDDLAALALGLGKLAAATFHVPHAAWAQRCMAQAASGFQAPNGAFYRSPPDDGLPSRPWEAYDGAIPSGNALLAEADVDGSRLLTGLPPRTAIAILEAFSKSLQEHPAAHTALLCTLDDLTAPYAEVVVFEGQQQRVADAPRAAGPMLDHLREHPHPRLYPLWTDGHDDWIGGDQYRDELVFDFTGGPRAFICRDGACELPVGTPGDLEAALGRILATPSPAKARRKA